MGCTLLQAGIELYQIFEVDFDFTKIEDHCSPLTLSSALPAEPRQLLSNAVLSKWGSSVRAGAVSCISS
ncbi:hypothetical protein I79_016058 [Cricetulus griseus]|uniref:Uncharacterized protein n=1 Tax=Cricetulus griseus TaxID=10029 RepID=G3HYD3_CRIGR|nr:hypothetical protein I79_016058 [Cricetulus griseus]